VADFGAHYGMTKIVLYPYAGIVAFEIVFLGCSQPGAVKTI
jgi:hypothetical protein